MQQCSAQCSNRISVVCSVKDLAQAGWCRCRLGRHARASVCAQCRGHCSTPHMTQHHSAWHLTSPGSCAASFFDCVRKHLCVCVWCKGIHTLCQGIAGCHGEIVGEAAVPAMNCTQYHMQAETSGVLGPRLGTPTNTQL